jgi:hypothetical protein
MLNVCCTAAAKKHGWTIQFGQEKTQCGVAIVRESPLPPPILQQARAGHCGTDLGSFSNKATQGTQDVFGIKVLAHAHMDYGCNR